MPFIDPRIPPCLHSELDDFRATVAHILVEIPETTRNFQAIPGVLRVFQIATVDSWRSSDGPSAWALSQIGKYGEGIDAALQEHSEEYSDDGDIGARSLFVEFASGAILKAWSSEWGGLELFTPNPSSSTTKDR